MLHEKKVTWIRHRDLHLLTVGKATYTPDNRFQSVHNPQNDEWSLKVRAQKFYRPHARFERGQHFKSLTSRKQ
jgi:hypothetical protein